MPVAVTLEPEVVISMRASMVVAFVELSILSIITLACSLPVDVETAMLPLILLDVYGGLAGLVNRFWAT